MASETLNLLPQAAGYGVLVGVGAFFAIFIIIATKLSNKYLGEDAQSTEMFMTGGYLYFSIKLLRF